MEWSLTQNKLLAFHRLMRTDKPIGALLLLWPTLWALWVASPGVPPLWILAVFVAGVWLMRAAGCVVNDYAARSRKKKRAYYSRCWWGSPSCWC